MQRKPDWWCNNCQFKIFGSKDSCFKCGAKSPTSATAVKSGPNPSSSNPHHKKDWICPKCNFKVFGSKSTCGKCNFTPNNNTQPSSQQQQQTPPQGVSAASPSVTIRPGDWSCSNCNDLNFGSRLVCRQCGTQRPKPEGESQTYPIISGSGATNTSPAPSGSTTETRIGGAAEEECVVCMDRKRTVVVTVCGHVGMCEQCARELDQCPICRANYQPSHIVKLYVV
jgi:ribosomal protein L40E